MSALLSVVIGYCWALAAVLAFVLGCGGFCHWRLRRRLNRLRTEKFDPIRNWRGGRL